MRRPAKTHCDVSAMAELPATVTQCAKQARELIRETAAVHGVAELRPMPVDADLHAALDEALLAARLGLTRHLELAASSPQHSPTVTSLR
jgi:hypothetical protein